MSEEFDPDKFIEDNKHLLEENQPSSQNDSGYDDDKFADDFIAKNIQYLQLDDERTPFQKAKDWVEPKLRGAAQGALFGFPDEITARAESVFTDKPYEQALRESRANYKSAQERDPWGYGASELGGAILSPINKVAMPISALKKAMDIKKYAGLAKMAQAAINGSIQGGIAGYGYGDDIGDVGTGAGVSAALSSISPAVRAAVDVPAVGNAVKKVGEYAGKALQGPEHGADYLSLGIGKILNLLPGPIKDLSQSIIGKGNPSNYDSILANKYKNIILGEAGKNVKIKEELGDIVYRKFNDLNQEERQKVFQAMKNSLESRSRNAYSPSISRIEKSVSDQVRDNPHFGDRYVGDMVNATLKNDVAKSVNELLGAFKTNIDNDTADAIQLQMQELALKAVNDIENGVRDRNLNLIKGNENAFTRKGNFADIVLDLQDNERIAPSKFNPYSKKAPNLEVERARKSLDELMAGKKAMNWLGIGSDLVSAYKTGSSTGGIIPFTVQAAGKAGSALENYSKSIRPEQIADSFLANPSFLQQLSQREGKLGIMAGNVLKELQSKGVEGAKSKLFLLAIDPDFRRLFAVDEKTGQTNTANSNPQSQERNKPWVAAGTP